MMNFNNIKQRIMNINNKYKNNQVYNLNKLIN